MFKERFQFSRERLEFYYSISLLIIIPVLIVANTVIMSVSVRHDFDSELRLKAALANGVMAESIKSKLQDSKALQKQVSAWAAENAELVRIVVVKTDGTEESTVIASAGRESGTAAISPLLLQTAVTSKKSIAQEAEQVDGERLWRVVTPIQDASKVEAVVVSDVSSKHADGLISTTLLRSLVIVIASVVLIVLLLLNHFKFVQYAMLFRRMKEVDQLKNDFLSVATHELRAPMTVIKGSVENLVDGITGSVDAEGKAALRQVSAEADRLNELVSDLLNVSRLEQGRITYQFENVDSRAICTTIVESFRAKAEEKGLVLVYESPENNELIRADKGRLIEVFTNLVDNAIKYSRQGTVTLSHKSTPHEVVLSVRDTGIGMTAKDRERLFSRFYRIQNDSTAGIPGTGLGLWIIKQYIEAMHGTIAVDSIMGVGTEFIVRFPRAASE